MLNISPIMQKEIQCVLHAGTLPVQTSQSLQHLSNSHCMLVLLSRRLLWHYFGNPALFLFLKACVSHWLWKDSSPQTFSRRNVPGFEPMEHILLASYVPCCLPLFPDHTISNAILPLTDNTAFTQFQTFTPLLWPGHAPIQSEFSCGWEGSKVNNRGGDAKGQGGRETRSAIHINF